MSMSRNIAPLATALLLGFGSSSPCAADEDQEKAKEAPSQVIRWTGSAYADGDAFRLTAGIFLAKVELHWDGFAGDSFEFLDDREQQAPIRVKKDYLLTDAATVQAFKTLAVQGEQCDPGNSSVIGQGISTHVVVESPPGTTKEEMSFFATPARLVKPNRLESIPFQVKDLVRKEVPQGIPAENSFAASIRDLAADLSRFAVCRDKLLASYKAKGDLPVEEMEALRVPVELKRAFARRGRNLPKEDEENSRKLLSVTKALLRDCLGPAQRARFTGAGEGRGEGGIVFAIEEGVYADNGKGAAIYPECLSVQIGTEEQPLAHLPKELEDVLLRFLGDPAIEKSEKATTFGLGALEVYRLGINGQGRLELELASQWSKWDEGTEGHGASLATSLTQPELQSRLEYLNSKGIVRFLLGREAPEGKVPALVRIGSLMIHGEGLSHARIEHDQDDARRVDEIHLVEGKWMPIKSRTWEEYQGEEENK